MYGAENIPDSGAFIIASNHLGRMDVPLVYSLLDREDVIMLVAEKYKTNPIIRWFVKQLNGVWVDRFNADFGALRAALGRLKRGNVLVIAPEGTRSPTGALIEGRAGAGFLAAWSGVPVVPVAVTGTEDDLVKAQVRQLHRPHINVQVGVPFCLPPIPDHDRETALQVYTDEIMCRIAALLPSKYRGVYANHPKLLEYLATQTRTA
jgi:1-acyl-sn-glycerol-3-phosphate acyltransferase